MDGWMDACMHAWMNGWMDGFVLGSSPYGTDGPRNYRRTLCAPLSDISSGGPCPFTKVPDGPQTKILISSGSKKGNHIYYPFLSRMVLVRPFLQSR